MSISEAAERNKTPILNQLSHVLNEDWQVLELGCGTGQHALCFSENLPVTWQPTDVGKFAPPLLQREPRQGLLPYAPLDINIEADWPPPGSPFDAFYCANVIHTVPEETFETLFANLRSLVKRKLIFYGPFKYDGEFTSQSNAEFEKWLHQTFEGSGIKDFEKIRHLARSIGFEIESDISMPANNQLLVFSS